jgi:hypothetical protein
MMNEFVDAHPTGKDSTTPDNECDTKPRHVFGTLVPVRMRRRGRTF